MFPCTVAEESSIAVYDDGDCWVLEAKGRIYRLLPDEAKTLGRRLRNFLNGEDFDWTARPGGFDLEGWGDEDVALIDSKSIAYGLGWMDAFTVADILDPDGAEEAVQ